jgi:ABC-2 type transport system ATP-binding protein
LDALVTAIVVEGLRVAYGDFEAVRGIDLRVEEGEVVAVLGPNGAGKTSMVEVLEGLRKRSAGQVEVLGTDPATNSRELKQRVGVVLQETVSDPYLTVTEVLRKHAGYYDRPRSVPEVVALVGLEDKAKASVKTLSGGQRRRLDVGLGIIGDPELVFLDEPTTGFDPSARRSAWDLVRGLSGGGTTVLLTTHYMDEAQALADRVIILAAGQVVAEGPPSSLGGRDHEGVRIRFKGVPGVPFEHTVVDGMAEVRTHDETRVLHDLTGWALSAGVALEGLVVERPSLEDVYLRLTS